MLEDLIQLQRSGRLGEAEDGYRQWLAAHPDDAEALHLLGILRAQRGDVQEGLALVTRASELEPGRATCWYTLGEMQLSQGRLEEAGRAYEQARGLNPNLAAVHAGLGRVALRRGDLAAAESHFKVALRADENDVQALGGLGTVAGARGDASGALKWFTEATRFAPDGPDVQVGYAHAMLDLGLLDFAGQALDKALSLRPDEPRALALRAEVHVRKREVAEALPILEGLIARGEQPGAAHTALGDIARLRGLDDEAIAQYDEALRADPGLHQAAIRRADSLARSGQLAQAIDGLRAHVAGQPDDVETRVGLATLLARSGRPDDALDAWREAEAHWPDDIDVKALHALALDRTGHADAALAKADLAAASPRPALAMLRARGALLAGDPAAAVQRLQRIDARQFEGKPPQLARRFERLLGLAFDRLEQWQDAVDAFGRAQRLAVKPLPELPLLDDTASAALQRLAEEPGVADARGSAPILLCGLPGSGVGEVAALLSDQPGWFVRHERFDAVPDFIGAPFDLRLAQLDPAALALLARRYRLSLERIGAPAGGRIVDWIPVLDARVVPAIRRALPGTRLVIVAREPRDALLDWLAFGGSGGFAMPDPAAGARWQRTAAVHLAAAARMLPSLWVDPDVPLAAGDSDARMQLRAFLRGLELAPGPAWRGASTGRGGLPARFPPGHAAHYHEVLSEAFTALGS
ncbi:MAG: tetratricopeptide repeat protein [Rhodanobacteraceae bacterium]